MLHIVMPVSVLTWCVVEDRESVEEEKRRKRMQVVEKFQTAPFEEIAAHCGARVSWTAQSHIMSVSMSVSSCKLFLLFQTSLLQSKLDQIFNSIICPPPSPSGLLLPRSTPLYMMKFPDLCVY